MSRPWDIVSGLPPRAGRMVRRTNVFRDDVGVALRSRRVGGDGVVPGLLSIVVPVYNVEDYLDECLLSLRQQKYRNVEIIVVDDGSPDRSITVARRHRRRDPRVRIIRRENGGLSAARNTGVAAARGEFLAFVDSDDTVQPYGYSNTLKKLERSGSDFAVTCYQRIKKSRIVPASRWIRDVHARDRLGMTLDRAPDAMRNSMACSKIFRTHFWRNNGLAFVEGIQYEDQQLTAEAYARAASFDVLSVTLYNWRQRDDHSSITASRNDPARAASNLSAQLDSAFATYDVLAELAGKQLAGVRALQIVRNDLAQFLQRVPFTGDDFWEVLTARVPRLLDLVSGESYDRQVPIQQKRLHRLIRTGARDEAVELIASDDPEFVDTFVVDGSVHARVRLDDGTTQVFQLADSETEAHSGVRRIREPEPGILELEGWALVTNLSLPDAGVDVRCVAISDGQPPVELDATTFRADWIDELHIPGDPSRDYRSGGLRVRMDVASLPEGAWRVQVTVELGGIARTSLIHHRAPHSTCLLPRPVSAGPGRVALAWVYWNRPFTVEVRRPGAVALGFRGIGNDEVELVLEGPRSRDVFLRRPINQARVAASHTAGEEGLTTLRFPLPGHGTSRRWTVLTPGEEGEPEPVGLAPAAAGLRGDQPTMLLPDRMGTAVVRAEASVGRATSVQLAGDAFEAVVSVAGQHLGELVPCLRSVARVVQGTATVTADGLHVRIPWTATGHDGVARPLPSDWYRLELVDPAGESTGVLIGGELADVLPYDELVAGLRAVASAVLVDDRLLMGVHVLPPLVPEERGPRNQARLRALANGGSGKAHSVFFRTLFGEATNDTARELHRELRRRGSDRELVWSVQDRSIAVPTGGVGLVEGSESWHRALGEAGCVVVNMHQPVWFRRPANQLMVETFHGYPYKRMGYSHWVGTGLPARNIASYFDRARDWTHLVSPSAYATPLLLREFFDPHEKPSVQVIEAGYPRNDPLLAPDAGALRSRVREQFGLPEEALVVLYAPTFRDALSVDGKSAQRADFLGPDQFVSRMGENCYLLLRGHAFHMRDRAEVAASDRVIDVTHHPDITDLILASDAAILDYSSLRFDYALTRKPMVFLVPDEHEYHSLRPGLLPYDETAPGPHVTDTRSAATALADLDRLRIGYGPAIEEFVAKFMEREDGRAAGRVVDAIFGPGERANADTPSPSTGGV